VCVWSKLVD